MREKEFWALLEEVFGRAYGRSIARDQVIDELESMTVYDALDAGIEPRRVWNALCDHMHIPDAQRWGKNQHTLAPPSGI